MPRDSLVGSSSRCLGSAGACPLALCSERKQSSDDRPTCLENPRPAGAESTLTENVASPFQAEPRHHVHSEMVSGPKVYPADQQVRKFRISGIIYLRLLRGSPFWPVRLRADFRLSSPSKLRRGSGLADYALDQGRVLSRYCNSYTTNRTQVKLSFHATSN
jgi:hypothetical protein